MPDSSRTAPMILIAGLGNPGRKYRHSRHNLGFRVVDRLAGLLHAPAWKTQGESLVTKGRYEGRGYLLAKPQTYMNHSGRAVQSLLAYFRIPLEDCLVVVDDLDLEPGKIRQRREGSDGGHRGLRSIIESVGSKEFKRIRIGIGRPPGRGNVISFVLGGSKSENAMLEASVEEAGLLALKFLKTGTFENWSSS